MVNHLAGGTVFTGFFASVFFGINILASPYTIVATVIASLLPDVDHTRSMIGKAVFPLARWINRRFGHRTLTHGLPCMAGLGLASGIIEKTFFGQTEFTAILLLGYFSHLIFDMCTLQGVPLLYPFSRSPFVLIGNPEARIRTGDYRREAVALGIFIAAGFSMQGLFANGFWTTYNQQFATLRHLHSEFLRSRDLLLVNYEIHQGTLIQKGKGHCIESRENEAWLLDSTGHWLLLKSPECLHSLPSHTGRSFQIRQQPLVNLTADSLNCFLQELAANGHATHGFATRGHAIQRLELQANQAFQYTDPGSFPKTASSYQADHLDFAPAFSSLREALSSPDTALSSPVYPFGEGNTYLASIAHLQREIRILEREQAAKLAQWQRTQDRLSAAHSEYTATTEVAIRQRLHEEINELEKGLSSGLSPQRDLRIEELQSQIQKIREEHQLRQREKREAFKLKTEETLSQIQETRFTGMLVWVEIH